MTDTAVRVLHSMVNSLLVDLVKCSVQLIQANQKKRISSRDIQTSVRMLLPQGLVTACVSTGVRRVTTFFGSIPQDRWFAMYDDERYVIQHDTKFTFRSEAESKSQEERGIVCTAIRCIVKQMFPEFTLGAGSTVYL